MLWALIMQPETQYTQHVRETFRLTMASMDILLSDDKPAQIIMSSKDKKFLLCTLQKDKVWQVPLNLIVEQGSVITFSCNGASYIHLTGYVKFKIPKVPKEDWLIFFFKQIMNKNITELKDEYTKELFDYLKKHNAKRIDNWMVIYRPSLNKELEYQNCKEQGKKNKHAPTDETRGSKRLKCDNNCERMNESNSNENTKESDVDDNCQDDESSSDDDFDDSSSKDENVDVEMQESKEEKSGERNKNKKRQGKREKATVEEKFKGGKNDKTNGEENEKRKYTINTPKGDLEVEVIRPGTGDRMAKKGDNVTTYYVARAVNGKNKPKIVEFEKGIGFRFKLGARPRQTLRGVDMGVVGMKIGEKRRLTMSHGLAYSFKGNLPDVLPFDTIIYNIELKKIDNYD